MLNNLSGWHLVVVLAIVLLLFGAPKLPGLARSLGQSMRIFRSEVKTMKQDATAPDATEPGSTASGSAEPASAAAPERASEATAEPEPAARA